MTAEYTMDARLVPAGRWVLTELTKADADQLIALGSIRTGPPGSAAIDEAGALMTVAGVFPAWRDFVARAYAALYQMPMKDIGRERRAFDWPDRDGVPGPALRQAWIEAQATFGAIASGGALSTRSREDLIAAWKAAGMKLP